MEKWKDIKDYEGRYQISNLGRCKSLRRMNWNGVGYWESPELILKPLSTRGYHMYILRKNSTHKAMSVHQLVGKYFIPNPNNLPEINHIDRNKHNNKVSNLEWMTHADNMKHYKESNYG